MTVELGVAALAFIALACLLAGLAHGALGFGFPLVATPLVALVVDIKVAIGVLAPVTLVLVLISAVRGGGTVEMARRFWFLPFVTVAGSWLGTRLLLALPPEPFVLVLALVMIVYLNLDRLGRGTSPLVQRHAVMFGLAFGFAAGIFESVANVAGPMLLLYFMLLGVSAAPMVQAMNLCFTFGKGTQVATWVAAGAMAPGAWLAVAALTVPSVGALFLGMRLRNRIDAATYRSWLRKALGLMALLLIGQFLVMTKVFASDEALFAAIEQNKEVFAEGLVSGGRADANARNARRETPLHRAVEKGMKSLAVALVRARADLRARSDNGETALHLAALHEDPFFVDLLLRAGADPKVRNDDGETPLMWAALSGHLVVAQRLLNDGADPNVADVRGNLPLHGAADGGYAELVMLLLPRTTMPQMRNKAGQTARELARERGHESLEPLFAP